MEDADAGLLAIDLSDSEDSSEPKGPSRAEKLVQSEEAFQQAKATYRPTIQNGEAS